MINKEEIKRLAEEKAAETGSYVVDVEVHPGNKIVVEIDNDNGVVIKECVNISRHIEGSLDREVEDFELLVSSAGLDKPFKIQRQYLKNKGRQVEVVAKTGEKYTGALKEAGDDGITIEYTVKEKQGNKKVNVTKQQSLTYDQIKETKAVVSFK